MSRLLEDGPRAFIYIWSKCQLVEKIFSAVHRNRTIDFSIALPTEPPPPPLLPTNRCQLSVSARTPTRNETSQVLLNRPNRSSSISEIKARPRPTSFQSASKQPPPRQMSLGTNRATPVGKQQKGKILFLWVHLQLLTSSFLGFDPFEKDSKARSSSREVAGYQVANRTVEVFSRPWKIHLKINPWLVERLIKAHVLCFVVIAVSKRPLTVGLIGNFQLPDDIDFWVSRNAS